MEPYFSHRACYVNFAEHLQNNWNPNVIFPNAPNQWSLEDWEKYFVMIKNFGFNIFEFWLPPTMFDPIVMNDGEIQINFKNKMKEIIQIAHKVGIKVKALIIINTIGQKWYFACPSLIHEKELILSLWDYWTKELNETDYFGIFPGDPGGCNRNGCTHETYIEMCLLISHIIDKNCKNTRLIIGTWGTPFSGWGEDYFPMEDWVSSWKDMETEFIKSGWECPIWNGRMDRAKRAMEYFISQLDRFPKDAIVEMNIGLSSNATYIQGGPAKTWAREIARKREIITWDYSLSEGELITYPHWRLPRMSTKYREWRAAAPYIGGMSYTMTPKLSLLTQYSSAQMFINPDACPDKVSQDFCEAVFGRENRILGELFEAFEIVDSGWGHFPRNEWSKEALIASFNEIIERLSAADMSKCTLPLFPEPSQYRDDLLWFAYKFKEMAGDNPDREKIKKEYWEKSMKIYDFIPMSEDKRADLSSQYFSNILKDRKY